MKHRGWAVFLISVLLFIFSAGTVPLALAQEPDEGSVNGTLPEEPGAGPGNGATEPENGEIPPDETAPPQEEATPEEPPETPEPTPTATDNATATPPPTTTTTTETATGTANATDNATDAPSPTATTATTDNATETPPEPTTENETAEANQPPVLETVGDKTGTAGAYLSFTLQATDPDGDNLTYSAINVPVGATFDQIGVGANGPVFGFTWWPAEAGIYPDIEFRVSDGKATDSETITITINPAPVPAGRIVTDGIWIMDADGSNRTRLTDEGRYPALSRDGSRIIFVSNRDGNKEIYVMGCDGSDLTRLTNDAAEDSEPTWSPDGTKIAFVSNRDGNRRLWVMESNGADPVKILDQEAYFSDWSPDGTKIAFLSPFALFTANPDGSGLAKITDDVKANFISWSADSRKILHIGLGLNSVLAVTWVVPPGPGEELHFSTGGWGVGCLTWGPVGNWIAYNDGVKNCICLQDLDTGSVIELTGIATTSLYWGVEGTPPGPPENQPPVLNPIGDKSVYVGQILEFTVSADDPDGDDLTYSASGLPSGSTFSNSEFSWTPSEIGTYTVTFTVDDGNGGTDTETIKITANEAEETNQPPVLNPIGNKTVETGKTLMFTVWGTDPDGDNLVVTAANLPEGASFKSQNCTFSWTPSQPGTYPGICFTISDGELTDSEQITITVTAQQTQPTITPTTPAALQPPSGGGSGGGGTDTKRFTTVAGSCDQKGVLWEDVTALSVDIQCALTLLRGTTIVNANGYPINAVTVTTIAEPGDTPEGVAFIGCVYEFSPKGTSISPSANLTLVYEAVDVPHGVIGADIVVAMYDQETGEWRRLKSSADVENRRVSAAVTGFSQFVLMAGTRPAAFDIGQPGIVPGEIRQNGNVSVTVTVTNTGDLSGDCRLVCRLDGEIFTARTVKVRGGGSEEVEFAVPALSTGVHTVDINGAKAGFTVVPGLASFQAGILRITPDSAVPGETIIVSMTVVNTGETRGEYVLDLIIDGVKQETRTVELRPGQSEEVSFEMTASEPGTYRVDLNGQTGTFEVTGAPPETLTVPRVTVAPAAETATTTPEEGLEETPQPAKKSSTLTWILSGVAVVSALAITLVGYRMYQKRNR